MGSRYYYKLLVVHSQGSSMDNDSLGNLEELGFKMCCTKFLQPYDPHLFFSCEYMTKSYYTDISIIVLWCLCLSRHDKVVGSGGA